MERFIGRKRELSLLRDLPKRKTASLVVLKGRRRIGKSRLVAEFAEGYKFLNFTGLAPSKGITAKTQKEEFARQLARHFNIPIPYSSDWGDLFWHLAHHAPSGRQIILFDEISWMGMKDPTFLGKLRNAWDTLFKKNSGIIFVICGSVSSWIEKNILSSTGFVGQVDLTLTLNDLDLQECNEFWGANAKTWSAYEKFKILSITGGVPRYLELISTHLTAEDNIKKLCFVKEGFLYNEFDKIFNDLFGKKYFTYRKILLALAEKPHSSLSDVFESLKMKKSGAISDYVEDMVVAGFLRRDFTWSLSEGSDSALSHLRISDNYVRFYLKYILSNQSKIKRDAFVDRTLTTLPGWEVLMGYQFENLVLNNRSKLHKLLHVDPNEIVNDNPYFQRQTSTRPGCQIDYMIQTRFNCLYIFEIKFSRKPVGIRVIEEIKAKIKALNLPKNFSYRPILIHVNGVEDALLESEFFANIIDFGSLLENANS